MTFCPRNIFQCAQNIFLTLFKCKSDHKWNCDAHETSMWHITFLAFGQCQHLTWLSYKVFHSKHRAVKWMNHACMNQPHTDSKNSKIQNFTMCYKSNVFFSFFFKWATDGRRCEALHTGKNVFKITYNKTFLDFCSIYFSETHFWPFLELICVD